jgi:hypothetical protein
MLKIRFQNMSLLLKALKVEVMEDVLSKIWDWVDG